MSKQVQDIGQAGVEFDGLTTQQSRFVTATIEGKNGRQAVIEAGYSENGASVTANRLLKNPKIQAAIQRGLNEARSDAVAGKRECNELLTRYLRAKVTDYLDPETGMLDINLGDPAAIQELHTTRNARGEHVTRFKLVDKLRADERLSKHESYDAPTKMAPTDPSGEHPYQGATPEVLLAAYELLHKHNDGDGDGA